MKNFDSTKKNKISADQFFTSHRIHVDETNADDFVQFFETLREELNSSYLSNISSSNKTMDKKNMIISPQLLFGGGIFLALITALFVFTPILFKSKTIGGEIVYVEGNVEYKSQEGGWFDASENTSLAEGASVRILDNGKVIINLDDGSVLRLGQDSQITLTSMNPKNIQVENNGGVVYSRIVESDRKFIIDVEGTQFVSLGTSYKTINVDEKKGVRVYQNKVKVINEKGEEEAIVPEGNKYYFKHNTNQEAQGKIIEMTPEEIKTDEFVVWNKQEDEKIDEFKNELGVLAQLDESAMSPEETAAPTQEPTVEITDKPEETPVPTVKPTTVSSKISLSATPSATGIKFTWSVSGIDTSNGFKIVRSTTTSSPVYPGNDYYYISDSNARSYFADLKDGKTYFVRVCQYLGGSCGVYSNSVKVTAPTYTQVTEKPIDETTGDNSTTTSVTSISLTGSGSNFSWSVNGYSSGGYKLVWSKNTSPTYPCREGDYYNYYSSPDTKSGTIDAKDGSGTYYVRVCEYLGGECGVYSNQISVEL